MGKCLYCYKQLAEGEVDYHKGCARKIFETTMVPALSYTRANIGSSRNPSAYVKIG